MTDSDPTSKPPSPSSEPSPQKLKRIKTGATERRASMARVGVVAGAKLAAHSMAGVFYNKADRESRRSKHLAKQTRYLVDELGQLKGSIVKVGQMMALYGEHFLPDEVTEALHGLEDETVALDWPVVEAVLQERLGSQFSEFEFASEPLGAASLSQVHLGVRKADGRKLAFKVQYPGVQDAIDSDLKALTGMMRMGRMIPKGPDFDAWLEEVRQMLHYEVDYRREMANMENFRERLAGDPRYIIPETFPEYSCDTLLVSSFEPGVGVGRPECMALSQARRNRLALAKLELFLREFFQWGELQTDPNFGNYRLRIDPEGENDRLVLLDFGAVRAYDGEFLRHFRDVAAGAFHRQPDRIKHGGIGLQFMSADFPDPVLDSFVEVAYMIMEPFTDDGIKPAPPAALTAAGEYCWGISALPERMAAAAGKAAFSRHFQVPPSEFVFLVRKMVGVYTFLAVLDARIKSGGLLADYLP